MATVKLTDNMIRAITQQVRAKKTQELNKVSTYSLLVESLRIDLDVTFNRPNYLDDVAFQGYAEVARQLPKSWFSQENRMYALATLTDEQQMLLNEIDPEHRLVKRHTNNGNVAIIVGLNLNKQISCSSVTVTSSWNINEEIHRLRTIDASGLDEVTEALKKQRERTKIETYWAQVEKEILDYLKDFKSLNAAVKKLPALKAFIPSQTMERLEKRVERASSSAPSSQADLSIISSSAMRTRFI